MDAPFTYTKILVPLDFSDDSGRALDHAIGIAVRSGASLVLATVIEDSFPYPELFAWDRPNEEFYKAMRERALHHMDQMLGDRAAGIPVERVVVKGKPRHEIAALARDVGADLIVLARHGSSGLRTAFMGSTALALLREAHCAVLVLPPAGVA